MLKHVEHLLCKERLRKPWPDWSAYKREGSGLFDQWDSEGSIQTWVRFLYSGEWLSTGTSFMEAVEPLSLDYPKSHGPWHLVLPSPVSVGELDQMTSRSPFQLQPLWLCSWFSCNSKHKAFWSLFPVKAKCNSNRTSRYFKMYPWDTKYPCEYLQFPTEHQIHLSSQKR